MTTLSHLSDAEITAEMARILDVQRARASPTSPGALAEWLTRGKEMQAPHLAMIDRSFQKVGEGTQRRVLITMPPRRGKSRRAARWGALWYLRKFPLRRVVVASYGSGLADEHGAWVRDQIKFQNPDQPLGITLDPSSTAGNLFQIATSDPSLKGGMQTVGVGGGFTGRGAHLLIVDDPVKDADTADSPAYRRQLWNWWTEVAIPRMEPGGAIVVIQTRWHEKDLAGRILAGDDNEEWEHLNLPELAEEGDLLGRAPGEPLWPERFSLEEDAITRKGMGERGWAALYQQRPRPLEGVLWQQDWIDNPRWADPSTFDINLCRRIVTGVDPSGTAGGDECGIVTVGIGFDDEPCPCGSSAPLPHLYVLGDGSGHYTPEGWAQRTLREYQAWDADTVAAETNFGADMVKSNLKSADIDLPVVEEHASKGKAVRAEPVANLYQQERIHHVGRFPQLEQEQLSWRPDARWSPNRLDALVWAVFNLRLGAGTRVRVLA